MKNTRIPTTATDYGAFKPGYGKDATQSYDLLGIISKSGTYSPGAMPENDMATFYLGLGIGLGYGMTQGQYGKANQKGMPHICDCPFCPEKGKQDGLAGLLNGAKPYNANSKPKGSGAHSYKN